MKTQLMLALLLLSATSSAKAMMIDGKEGGGGDTYAIEFLETGKRVLTWVQSNPASTVNIDAFAKALTETTVESTDEALTLDGKEKDAINYPALHKIVFRRSAWDRAESASLRNVLVFHEYLGILGINDSKYQISSNILHADGSPEGYTKCSQLPPAKQSLFKLFNRFAKNFQPADAWLYIGALLQYRQDIAQMGNNSDPMWGKTYDVSLFESQPSYLCTDTVGLEKKAQAGDEAAIQLVLLYSAAVKGGDGADAGILGDLQEIIREKYPRVVKKILAENKTFFAQYPMVWTYEK